MKMLTEAKLRELLEKAFLYGLRTAVDKIERQIAGRAPFEQIAQEFRGTSVAIVDQLMREADKP